VFRPEHRHSVSFGKVTAGCATMRAAVKIPVAQFGVRGLLS
jgi:hypothetical protein